MNHVKHFRRRGTFALIDLILAFLTFVGAVAIRITLPLPFFMSTLPSHLFHPLDPQYLAGGLALGCLFVLFVYVLGIYDEWQTDGILLWLKKLFVPNLVIVGLAFSYLYIDLNFVFPRSILVTFFGLNLIMSAVWRSFYFARAHGEVSEVVLVGTPASCRQLLEELTVPPYSQHIRVLAVFSPGAISLPTEAAAGIPLLPLEDLRQFSVDTPYSSVIVVPSERESEATISNVLSMSRSAAPIYLFPSLFEILIGRLRHVRINDIPLVEIRINRPAATYYTLKRIFDVSLAIVLLALLSLPMLIIAMFVRTTSRGNAIFTQERVGKNGELFRILKFRTMIDNAESGTGPVWSPENDPRITPLGQFLRTTRLDETPQLINILRGEMSFVGPRPERPMFVEQFIQEIPGYRERLRIRPGVTGLAQVSGNYDSSPVVKLKYDLAYVVNQSFIIDLEILLKTARSVLTRRGR